MRPNLIQLWKELYEHTNPACGQCRVPFSCCSSEYCEMAKQHIKDAGEDPAQYAPIAPHPKLPFLETKDKTACTVPPHLRPLCTLHHCGINGIGFKSGDPEWTKKYFDLRQKIEELHSA